ncbi:MAG TPA: site-specific integrase, partial [Polyangia bacterium]
MDLPLDSAIQQFLDHLRVERELSVATLAAYGHDLTAFSRFAAARELSGLAGLRPIHILDYLSALTENALAARSQARALVALRQFFRFLKSERLLEIDPTEDVDLPRFGRPLGLYIRAQSGHSCLAQRNQALLATLAHRHQVPSIEI